MAPQFSRRAPRSAIAVAAAAVVTALLVMAGCSTSSGQSATHAKTLVVAMSQGSLRTLDPNNAYEPEWFVIGHEMYQTLVSFSGSDVSKVTPSVATSWTVSPDGKTYTFHLDPRAKFADGAQLTASDAVFALQRFQNTKGPGAWMLDNMASATAVDPETLVVTLKSADYSFLSVLTSPSLGIGEASKIRAHGGTDAQDADKLDKAQSWLDANSVGSGPYVLKSWVHNTELVLERNPHFWMPNAQPQVDQVIFKFVSDTNSQLQMVQRGDAAIAMDLTPDQIATLKGSPSVAVARTPALAVMYLGWTASPGQSQALANPANWDAIRYALDYDGIVELSRGAAVRAGGIVPAALAGGLESSAAPKQDLAAARAALAKAGNPSGFNFTLTFASGSTAAGVPFDLVAQKIQTDLARVGIKVELKPELQVQFYADYRGGKLTAELHWWLADYADALDFLPVFVPPGSVAVKRQHWEQNASNANLVQLAEKAQATADASERASIIRQAQGMLNTTGPYSPLLDIQRQVAYNTDQLANVVTNPAWVVDLAAAKLK